MREGAAQRAGDGVGELGLTAGEIGAADHRRKRTFIDDDIIDDVDTEAGGEARRQR